MSMAIRVLNVRIAQVLKHTYSVPMNVKNVSINEVDILAQRRSIYKTLLKNKILIQSTIFLRASSSPITRTAHSVEPNHSQASK
mmetsp:Transcript_17014/g.27542  ORF Transcript_17014/g.27542 Transcript_17014/m.27542 type:complete len:84 (+) Transcript_17014:490-741(+)